MCHFYDIPSIVLHAEFVCNTAYWYFLCYAYDMLCLRYDILPCLTAAYSAILCLA